MSDASLKAVIGADVQGFVSGMQTANTATTNFNKSLQDLNQTFVVENNALNLSSGYLKQQAQAAQEAASSTSNLTEAAKDTSSSFDLFSGKISQQRVALVDLGRIVTGTGFTVRSLGSQLQLFSLPVVVAAAGLALFVEKVLLAADANQKLNETLGEGSASVQGQIAELKDLGAIALDNTNSTKDRATAFQKLQAEYPGYLGNLSLEKSSYDEINKALDAVSSALVRQAQIKGLEGAITDIFKELNKTVADGGTTFEKFEGIASGVFGVFSGGGDKIKETFDKFKQSSIGVSLADDTKEATKQIDLLNTKLQELLKTSLNDKLDQKVTVKPEVADQNISYLEKTKSLIEGLSKEDRNPLFKDFAESAQGALADINYNIFKDDIQKATELGLTGAIDSGTLQQYIAARTASFNKQANPNLTSIFSTELDSSNADVLSEKLKTVTHKLDKDAYLQLTIAGFDQASVAEAAKTAQKIADQFTSIINSAIESGIEALGKSVGTGSFKGFLTDLEEIIGQGLESLGKSLLAAYPIIKVAKEAIENAIYDPELIAIAGGLAVVAGAAIEGLASTQGIHAFADGGIVTGPTNALIGEAGPEVVFPLGELNRFIKNNNDSSPQMAVSGNF